MDIDRVVRRKRKWADAAVCIAALAVIILASYFLRLRDSIVVKASRPAGCGASEAVCFLQYDSAWARDALGDSDYTMGSSGCLTTCVAGALLLEKIEAPGIETLNPGTLNAFLSERGVYDADGNIRWEPLENAIGAAVVRKGAAQTDGAELEELLEEGIYPIVRVRVKGYGSFHFVLIVESDGKQFLCMDPMDPRLQPVSLEEFDNRIYAVRYIAKGDGLGRTQ